MLIAVAAGCSANAPGPASPSPPPTASPTSPPSSPTPTVVPPPTAEPTPSAEPTTTRTLAPGETPAPTPIDLLPFLTSEVTVVNLGDATLDVSVTLVDPESADEFELGTYALAPLQVISQSVPPARFRLDFDYAGADT
ncbi:MAG TPA: hypothetical protein VNW68_04715, partial [Candidatus Limnocylindria bacterium]|nr:hypothetical protein [Candidatus Limnocylindria bacterium]